MNLGALMGRMKTAGNSSYTYSAGENKRVAVFYPNGSGGGTMTFYLSSRPNTRNGGTHSLSLGQGSWAAQTIAGTIPSTSYSVSVWCIVPATGSSVSLTVGSGSAATLTTSSVWTSFYASGSSDTNGNLKITLAGGSSNGSTGWCDDLTISTVNPASPTLTWGQSFGFAGFGNLLSQTPTAGSAPRLNMT